MPQREAKEKLKKGIEGLIQLKNTDLEDSIKVNIVKGIIIEKIKGILSVLPRTNKKLLK